MRNKELIALKKAAFEYCEKFVEQRLQRIEAQIKEVALALASETKNTAGDKHETGRAMLQLEREKLGNQLARAEHEKALLARVNILREGAHVGPGSLIVTDQECFLVAISAGAYTHANHKVFCISANTPIAKLAMGKTKTDTFCFNEKNYTILDIA